VTPKPTPNGPNDADEYRSFRAVQSLAWTAYGKLYQYVTDASSVGDWELMAIAEDALARWSAKQSRWLTRHPARACYRSEWRIQLKGWQVLEHASRMMAKALRSPTGDTDAAFAEFDHGLRYQGQAADMSSGCH